MGLYERTTAQRRRRPKRSPLGPILVVLLLIALLALIGTVALHSCAPEDENIPGQEAELPQAPAPSEEIETAPVTEPATEAPTEEITEPTTEATTEPTTEPTEPTTEETTEPTTEPPTEPETEPTVPVAGPPTEDEKAVGQQIADIAKAQIGKEYEYGGAGPNTFDTSGFVKYCVNRGADISLPHSTSGQANMGARVDKEDLMPGDVVFFWTSDPEAVEYLGVYIGDGKFVAARNPEKPVSQLDLNSSYFTERYLFACRYW